MSETHGAPSPEGADIVDRLNAACVGHPHARIPWPHRLLHDAVDEITTLRARVAALEAEREAVRRQALEEAAGLADKARITVDSVEVVTAAQAEDMAAQLCRYLADEIRARALAARGAAEGESEG